MRNRIVDFLYFLQTSITLLWPKRRSFFFSSKPTHKNQRAADAGKMRHTEVYKTQTTNIFQIHESDYVETPHYLA